MYRICLKTCCEKFPQDAQLKIHYKYVNIGWKVEGIMINNLTTEVSVQS